MNAGFLDSAIAELIAVVLTAVVGWWTGRYGPPKKPREK